MSLQLTQSLCQPFNARTKFAAGFNQMATHFVYDRDIIDQRTLMHITMNTVLSRTISKVFLLMRLWVCLSKTRIMHKFAYGLVSFA